MTKVSTLEETREQLQNYLEAQPPEIVAVVLNNEMIAIRDEFLSRFSRNDEINVRAQALDAFWGSSSITIDTFLNMIVLRTNKNSGPYFSLLGWRFRDCYNKVEATLEQVKKAMEFQREFNLTLGPVMGYKNILSEPNPERSRNIIIILK